MNGKPHSQHEAHDTVRKPVPGWQEIILLMLLVVIFFSIPVVAAPDSSDYISNAHTIFGVTPFSSWKVYRGPTLSLIMRVSFFLFGESAYGTAMTFFLVYLVFVLGTIYIFSLLGWLEKWGRAATYSVCAILLFFNPTVLSYAHFILTEFPALSLSTACLCLILKTHSSLSNIRPEKKKTYTLLFRYIGVALFSVLLFALKQMYFALAVVPFTLSEILLLLERTSLRKTLYSIACLVMVALSVFGWSKLWGAILLDGNRYNQSSFSAGNLAVSTLVDGQRYFRIAQEDRGKLGEPINIDIMNSDYDTVIGSFTYTFNGTVPGSIKYLWACFTHSPARFFMSYFDNYRVVCNWYKVLDVELDGYLAYDPVVPRMSFVKSLFYSHENGYWLDRFRHTALVRGQTSYEDTFNFPPPNSGYIQGVDNNLITNTIFDSPYPNFSFFLYSFPAIISPIVFLLGIVFMALRRKESCKRKYWEKVFMFSGSIFGYISFLAVTASSMDRYAFPATLWCVVLLILLVEGLAVCAKPKLLHVYRLFRERG